jgi:hypothetical protein
VVAQNFAPSRPSEPQDRDPDGSVNRSYYAMSKQTAIDHSEIHDIGGLRVRLPRVADPLPSRGAVHVSVRDSRSILQGFLKVGSN